MNRRKIFSIIMVLTLLASTLTVSARNSGGNRRFNDVSEDHWAYEYIELMANYNIINGYGDGNFGPDDSVSREQFSKMMVLTLQLDLYKPSNPFFADVNKNDWAYPYVETARTYLTGFSSGGSYYFRPKENAVREDMAVAVVKGLGINIDDADLAYLDIFSDKNSISTNLKPYVAKAVEEGIMKGDDNGKFNPTSGIRRSEAATLLARLIDEEKVVFDEEKIVFDEDDVTVDANSGNQTPTLTVTVKEDKLYLDWTQVQSEDFKYYKVVASMYDKTPIYPGDGYMQAIGDHTNTDTYIKPNDTIKNGDTSKLLPNEVYYISITAVYEDDVRFASNTVTVTVPDGEDYDDDDEDDSSYVDETGRTPGLDSPIINSNGVSLDWSSTPSHHFSYYKVVLSIGDSSPVYPEDGYATYISDVSDSDYFIKAGDTYKNGDLGGKIESGQEYYVSITAVYSDGEKKYPSNTFKITMP